MRLTLLGSGNAAGMPVFGCDCKRCEHVRHHHDMRRRPATAMLEVDGKTYLIDAGLVDITDRYPAGTLDGILLTHFHVDHVQGLFHLRWGKGNRIPVYCPPDRNGCDDLFKHPGILAFQVTHKFESFQLQHLRVTPLPLIHSKVTFGYLFEYEDQAIAYLTDTKGLPPKTSSLLENKPLELLVIDTSYPPDIEASGHNNLTDTLQLHRQLKVKRTVLTHIDHDLDIWLTNNVDTLPESILAGRDNYLVYPY